MCKTFLYHLPDRQLTISLWYFSFKETSSRYVCGRGKENPTDSFPVHWKHEAGDFYHKSLGHNPKPVAVVDSISYLSFRSVCLLLEAVSNDHKHLPSTYLLRR